MIIDKTKFPFKWIPGIISELDKSENPLSQSDIAKKVDSCWKDTGEIARMLQYLTFFGKVTQISTKKWTITYTPATSSLPPQKNFRFNHIRELAVLIDILKDNRAMSEDEIARKTSHEPLVVQEVLSFLELITEKGRIISKKNKFPKRLSLEKWASPK